MRSLPVFLLFVVSTLLVQAQSDWTSVTSPTTQTLWGVCNGANRFVAVGESGTVISSLDGTTWSSQTSGTTRWLLGVAFANNLFVAVGEAGTILTSPDGATWTARTSGTAQRLNAIAYGAGTWLAMGEAGTALTSLDAITWTTRTTGETGWFRGLAYASGAFVAAGHDGTILVTRDGGVSFSKVSVATTAGLEGVAYDGENFHVVGAGLFAASSADGATWRRATVSYSTGTGYRAIAWSVGHVLIVGDGGGGGLTAEFGPASQSNWRALASDDRRVVAVGAVGVIATYLPRPSIISTSVTLPGGAFIGQPATFTAKSGLLTGVRWQWRLNGQPIAGATSPTLKLPSLSLDGTAGYSLSATLPDGSVVERTFTFFPKQTVLPNAPTLGVLDATYAPPFTIAPAVITPLTDGRVYVADRDAFYSVGGRLQHGLARLRADGSLDPTFNVGTGLDLDGTVTNFYPLRDGGGAILGTFSKINGVACSKLARLNADGSLDASFQPDVELSDSARPPILLRDDRWIIVKDFSQDGSFVATATVVRFDARGRSETNFPILTTLGTFRPALNVSRDRDAQGRVYLYFNIPSGVVPGGNVRRLNSDGSFDSAYRDNGGESTLSSVLTDDGMVRLASSHLVAAFSTTRGSLARYNTLTGASDPSFNALEWAYGSAIGYTGSPNLSLFGYTEAASDATGGLYGGVDGLRGHEGIVRLNSRGETDRDFALDLTSTLQPINFPVDSPSQTLLALPDGKLLAYGISSINGIAVPGLARLIPNRAAATSRLSNISIRARAGSGSQTLIVGYVSANGQKNVLVRGAGPALAAFGVTDALADPQLALYSAATPLATNDDWASGAQSTAVSTAAARVGAFAFAPASRDAALLSNAPAGAYTIQLTAKDGATGVALAELYDTDARPADAKAPRLVNFSARTAVGTGADALIAGFTIDGDNTRKVLIRAIGPTLAQFGVTGVLADPQLTLYRGNTPIATNDDWSDLSGDYRSKMMEAFRTVGAFQLPISPTTSKDAALLVSLAPGGYTVQVSGVGNTTGVALLEVYEIP